MLYRAEQLDLILGIVSQALGGKKKGKTKSKGRRKTAVKDKAQKEADFIRSIGAAGLPVTEV